MKRFALPFFVLGLALIGGCATAPRDEPANAEIGVIGVGPDIELRRMVVRNSRPKGTVLLLHGFPETIHAWKDIALALGTDYEVHAFDWPGYGLSSRPPAERFPYSPRDYARIVKDYIEAARIDKSSLVIYATDIGALPTLLAALEDPAIARKLIVGDFAPFDRPQYMNEALQGLKSKPTSDAVRAAMNRNRDEILQNSYRRGFSKEEQFDIPRDFHDDMSRGWNHGGITTADAFYHYYSHFSRDQAFLESNLALLKTPVKVVWGERDFYIKKEMGIEFARRGGLDLELLPGIGHYPHLQKPALAVEEIRAAFRR
jgi:pimeloyl-ACP methyl ester carboxylesterase